MYLAEWKPFVRFCVAPPNESKPIFELRAWLMCPFCREIVEVITTSEVLRIEGDKKFVVTPGPKIDGAGFKQARTYKFTAELIEAREFPISQFIYRAHTILAQHRTCKMCGVVSGMPETNFERAKKELTKVITTEWLSEQIDSLLVNGSYREQLEQLAEEREREEVEKTRQQLKLTTDT